MTSDIPHPTSDNPEKPVLRVRDLGVSFDNGSGPRIQAVDGVRMSIYPAQTLAVVGESGCGKSVTAMSTLQLIPRPPGRFDRGQVFFRSTRAGAGAAALISPAEPGEISGTGTEIDLLSLDEARMRQVRGNEIAMIFQEPMTS